MRDQLMAEANTDRLFSVLVQGLNKCAQVMNPFDIFIDARTAAGNYIGIGMQLRMNIPAVFAGRPTP